MKIAGLVLLSIGLCCGVVFAVTFIFAPDHRFVAGDNTLVVGGVIFAVLAGLLLLLAHAATAKPSPPEIYKPGRTGPGRASWAGVVLLMLGWLALACVMLLGRR